MFMQKLRNNKKGFTLIELVCAMAILAIITLTISGAMVFASNSYKQGSIDTALQQELQFTANAIESLIVDATSEVTFVGNMLKIVNTDYTYEIVYDSANKTLHYTQYSSVDGSPVATNELLADNVAHFYVDPSNFAIARNVVLEITLENGKSTLDYRYNITSRNDVSAGDKPNIVVEFMCENTVVVEPMQQYFLEVDMVGAPAGEDYYPILSGNTSAATRAVPTVGGVLIEVAPVETGDAAGRMTLTLASTVKDSTGAPFTKNVEILVRRVNAVSLTPAEYSGGGAYDAGTTYTCTASPVGTNLEKRSDLQSDTRDPYKYISPDNFVWSFDVSSGAWQDWITVGSTGTENSEIQITLKKKVEFGDWIKVTATSRHTTGEFKVGGNWGNKASYINGVKMGYDNKSDCFDIKPTSQVGDSDFRRGDDFQIPLKMDVPALVKQNWEDNPENEGKDWDDNKDGYNSGYTGNHHLRYVSKDNPNNFSVVEQPGDANGYSYKGWKKMDYQGNSIDGPNDADDQVFFSAADLDDMKYMETYTLEMVYSFTYMDKNNVKHTYPWCFDENVNPGVKAGLVDVPSKYIYEFTIDPIEVHFGRAKSGDDATIDLEKNGYLTPSGHGIGSASKPLVVNKTGSLAITYTTIGPGANDKAGVNNLLKGHQHLWKSVDGGLSWTRSGTININNAFNSSDPKKQTGTLYLDTNNIEKGDNIIYKLLLGCIDDKDTPDESDDEGGLIYTEKTGYEQYALNNSNGSAARGLIYFQLK